MALTPFIRGSQGATLATEIPTSRAQVPQAAVSSAAFGGSDLATSQALAMAAYAIPTTLERVSQTRGVVAVLASNAISASQAQVLAVVSTGLKNRRSRAWGFSLDGHDFYVLRLGDAETLVLDLSTGKWLDWDSVNRTVWRVHQGAQWIDMGRAAYVNRAASQIVAGDDTTGMLWTLDPAQPYDEPDTEGLEPEYFERRVTTGVPARMREAARNGSVFMSADIGSPALALSPATVELRTSDDNGKTYQSQGTVTITTGGYTDQLLWRSLGVIRAPGRIFEFTDYGATVRIDGIDAQIGEASKNNGP